MSELITITDSARRRIASIIELAPDQKNILGIKIGVKNAGCSGMTYTMDYAYDLEIHDEKIDLDGLTIVIEAAAVMFLLGTELDFKEEKLSSTFVFNNPNATSTCGCGESFSVG